MNGVDRSWRKINSRTEADRIWGVGEGGGKRGKWKEEYRNRGEGGGGGWFLGGDIKERRHVGFVDCSSQPCCSLSAGTLQKWCSDINHGWKWQNFAILKNVWPDWLCPEKEVNRYTVEQYKIQIGQEEQMLKQSTFAILTGFFLLLLLQSSPLQNQPLWMPLYKKKKKKKTEQVLLYSRLCPSIAGGSPPPQSSNFLCSLLSFSILLLVAPQFHLSNTVLVFQLVLHCISATLSFQWFIYKNYCLPLGS